MNEAEFRKAGYAAIDNIIDYHRSLGSRKPVPDVKPGFLLDQLPEKIPEHGESWEQIEADLMQKIMPGITHWQSANFFAWFPANSTFPGEC